MHGYHRWCRRKEVAPTYCLSDGYEGGEQKFAWRGRGKRGNLNYSWRSNQVLPSRKYELPKKPGGVRKKMQSAFWLRATVGEEKKIIRTSWVLNYWGRLSGDLMLSMARGFILLTRVLAGENERGKRGKNRGLAKGSAEKTMGAALVLGGEKPFAMYKVLTERGEKKKASMRSPKGANESSAFVKHQQPRPTCRGYGNRWSVDARWLTFQLSSRQELQRKREADA